MKRFLIVAACLVCVLGFAAPASAVGLGLDHLIGTVEDATPSGNADVVNYVNNLINWHNSAILEPDVAGHDYTLSAISFGSLDTVSAVGPGFDASFPIDTTGFSLLWVKFGEDGALYYVGNVTEAITAFTPPWGPFTEQGGGYSHATLLGPTQVPEGATLILLGFGLAGVGTLRRFMKR